MYLAVHRGHRPSHAVLAVKGESFPACRACGEAVRFELIETVPHATHDFDFAGPGLFLVKGSKRKRKRAS